MFDNETIGAAMLGNPTQLQYKILTEVTGRVLDSTTSIPSMNNAFCALLDASSSTTAQFVKQEDAKFRALYAQRAEYSSELYPHLSDYDYTDVTAKPCELQLKFVFDKNWIINNAVSYDDNFSMITISSDSVFKLGDRVYGMYYPINIKVNKVNAVVTTTYDITATNPLKTFSTNLVSDITTFTKDGSTYYQFAFTVWQFAKKTYPVTTSAKKGFSQSYSYTDQFYAARVYYLSNGSYVEFDYSLSQMMYNQSSPTAILTPQTDTGVIGIDIPQVYFTNNQISTTLKVEIYTTAGALNEVISSDDALNMTADLDTASSAYSAPLSAPTTLICVPYDQTSLVGGSDEKDITSLKSRIVTGSLYKSVPISPEELSAEVSDYGYSLYKYLDNITDRIYYAGAVLSFTDSTQVPTIVDPILLNTSNTNGDPSTIIKFSTELVTILPTTIFKYTESTGLSQPLTDAEVAALGALSVSDLATELNNNYYTRQPFHIVLSTADKYPAATSYNMMDPSMSSLMFVYENPHAAAQLTVTDIGITHLASGTGGYSIKLAVQFTAALTSTDKSYQRVFLYTTDKSGQQVYIEAAYLSSTSTYDVYACVLPTNYMISTDGYLRTSMLDTSSKLIDADIDLAQTWNIVGCVAMSEFPDIEQSYNTTYSVPSVITDTWIVTTQQTATLTLAENMGSLVNNPVTTTWGDDTYATYNADVYQTYGADTYMRDTAGNIVMRTNSSGTGIDLVKIRSATDYVLSGNKVVVSITAAQATPTATIAVSDVSQLLVGARVDGDSIVAGSTIIAIDTAAVTITLSATPTAVVSGTLLNVQSGIVTGTVATAQTAAGNTLTVSDATGILEGMAIYGFDIADGTTVTAINGNILTLSADTTAAVAANATIECFNTAGPYVKLHSAGDVQRDADGDPIVKESAANVYSVDAIQFDARLYAAQDDTSTTYVSGMTSTLLSNAHALDDIRNVLLERTSLYYKPFRTIGHASYGVGNGITETLPLAIGLDVTYYVSEAVRQNTTLTDEIKSLTITNLSSYITNNTVYSTSAISQLLTTAFSSNITTLDVSGFWRNDAYKTLAVLDDDVSPSLAWVLTKGTDQTLSMVPDVTVTFELDPSDTTST